MKKKLKILSPGILFSMIFCLLSACSDQNSSEIEKSLILEAVFDIEVSQPSGLTFGKNYQSLWTVSDLPDGNIYKIDFEGNIISKLKFKGEDLEGITYDQENDVLWVVDEQTGEIIKISPDSPEIKRISNPAFAPSNHGLEGISLENQNRLWVANEKLPRKLCVVNAGFSIEEQYEPDLAEDYSGLCVNPADGTLWIVSDESQLLIKWSPYQNNVEKYTIPIQKAEGIAINHQSGQIFIVSDDEEKLYRFRIE
ncbi:MAG: SdiA-regulated domain-containing protein [Calditrichaceae bacterium]